MIELINCTSSKSFRYRDQTNRKKITKICSVLSLEKLIFFLLILNLNLKQLNKNKNCIKGVRVFLIKNNEIFEKSSVFIFADNDDIMENQD